MAASRSRAVKSLVRVALAACVLSAPAPAFAQRTMNPVQFVATAKSADGKGYGFFIERPTERQGIANLHNFYVVPVKGARVPKDAEAIRLQLIFPCDAEEYQRFGMELWKGGAIVGGEGPAMILNPLPKTGQIALLRSVACGTGPKPSGPLLNSFDEMKAATEAAP